LKINDFTVQLPNIPVDQEAYDKSPELLTAMIAVLLEDVVKNEVQVIEDSEES
jgi:hypothetical protein